MPVYYQLDEGATPPRHAHTGDAGIDLALNHFLAVPPGGHKLGSTGVHVAIPHGHVGMIFVRSSTGIKRNLVLSNGTGIIDSGYRGELLISLHNTGHKRQNIRPGEYIAQLVTVPANTAGATQVTQLSDSERGSNGIGSSDHGTV